MPFTKKSHNLKVNCTLPRQPINAMDSTDTDNSPALGLAEEQPPADIQDWYGNLPLHRAATMDPPDLAMVQSLLKEYPDGAKTRNKFGRIPLHCAVDKVLCSPELVRVLVKAYPDGAAEEDDDGYSPLACALRWEHNDTVLKVILLHNRYENRGLYLVVRYGVLLGTLFRCMECTAHSSNRRRHSPSVSYAPAGTSQDVAGEGGRAFEDIKSDMNSSEYKTKNNSPESDVPVDQISPPTSPSKHEGIVDVPADIAR